MEGHVLEKAFIPPIRGRFRNWEFNINAVTISAKNKVKLPSAGGQLKNGQYLLQIKGANSARGEIPQDLIIDPIKMDKAVKCLK